MYYILGVFIFLITCYSHVNCLAQKLASSIVFPSNQSYQDVAMAVSRLNKLLDLESFNNFDIILWNSESFQFSEKETQRNSRLSIPKLNQFQYNNSQSYIPHNSTFSNFQLQFWPSHVNLTYKLNQLQSGVTNGNKNTLFCGFVTNWIDAGDLKNEIENYHKFVHNIYVDVLPYFFIFLNLPNGDTENTETKTKLEDWSKRFDISSQVYLVHYLAMAPNPDKIQNYFSFISVYEFYWLKNKNIVQLVFASEQNFNGGIKNKTTASQAQVKFSEVNKIKFLNLLKQKTQLRCNFHLAEIIAGEVDSVDYEANTKYRYETVNSTHRQPFFESGFNVLEFWYIRDALNFSLNWIWVILVLHRRYNTHYLNYFVVYSAMIRETAVAWPQYIRPGPNGSIVGMAIPINNGLIDLSIAQHEFLEYRVFGPDALIFTQPIFHNPLSVFFKQPPASSIRNIFLETFSSELWVTMVACWILVIVSMVAAQKCKKYVCGFTHKVDAQICRDSWLWGISATCMKGWHSPPRSTPMKMIFITGVLMAVVVYVAYSAALVSILSVPVVPVKTFWQLLEYNFKILSDNHIATATVTVKSLERQHVIPALPNDERNVPVDKNIENLLKNQVAIVTQMDAFYPVLKSRGYKSSFLCSQLSYVDYSRRAALSGWAMKKGSPLKIYFSYKLIVMKERGVMDRLRHTFILETTIQCSKESNGFHQQLGLNDLFTAFAFLFISVLVSIGILGGEKWCFRFYNKQKQGIIIIVEVKS